MKVGAERNKVILLAVLTVVAIGTIYMQYSGSAPATSPARPAAATSAPAAAAAPANVIERRAPRPKAVRSSGQAYRPTFFSDKDEPLDPMKVDPTLRTDLLAKVRSVEFSSVTRNLFQFTSRKVVEPPKPEMVAKAQELLKKAEPVAAPAAPVESKPSKPKAPPLKWKYYGFANEPGDARKRAFILDSEGAVFVATEGDIFSRRYKIVRIGVNSIVVEDMQYSDQQTLALDPAGRG